MCYNERLNINIPIVSLQNCKAVWKYSILFYRLLFLIIFMKIQVVVVIVGLHQRARLHTVAPDSEHSERHNASITLSLMRIIFLPWSRPVDVSLMNICPKIYARFGLFYRSIALAAQTELWSKKKIKKKRWKSARSLEYLHVYIYRLAVVNRTLRPQADWLEKQYLLWDNLLCAILVVYIHVHTYIIGDIDIMHS